MDEERGQKVLFPDDVNPDWRDFPVNVVDSVVDRGGGDRIRIGDLPEGDYRVVIANRGKVLHSVGTTIPRDSIYRSASVYGGFEKEGLDVYVELRRNGRKN